MEWKEFKKEYEKLEPQYKIIRQFIEKNRRINADLLERLKRGSSDAKHKIGRFV